MRRPNGSIMGRGMGVDRRSSIMAVSFPGVRGRRKRRNIRHTTLVAVVLGNHFRRPAQLSSRARRDEGAGTRGERLACCGQQPSLTMRLKARLIWDTPPLPKSRKAVQYVEKRWHGV